nr:hypothetical protein [Tanacetum cinerariifolium]
GEECLAVGNGGGKKGDMMLLVNMGEYSQWRERFMNYIEEQTDDEAMIKSIQNGDHPLPVVAQVSLAGTAPNAIPTLKDPNNKTAKDLWDALEMQMRGSVYDEQDRKAAILYEYETFKATEGEQLLDTYLRYLQVINDLKKCGYKKKTQNQGEVNDALRYKKKAVVVTSDPLALVAEKTKVCKQKEKVKVQTESEGSDDEDISDLKKITALLAKAFNRKKYYAKPKNNILRTSSASSFANKKPEYVKSVEKKEDKKVDENKRDMSKVKCYNCKKEGHFAKDCKKAKVKDYNYYKTKMLLAKKDSNEQVLLAEDQAWMESSSDSYQEINANMVFMAKMEKVIPDSDKSSSSAEETIAGEQNNEFNKQMKVLNEKNADLLAQTEVLQDQLKVKHVVIDTQTECQAQYTKLEEERYEYMIRYSAFCDNDKQHRKKIDEQEILFDKMSRQLVEMNNNVLRLQEKILEKETKISELEGCVSNKDAEIKKCLERLNDYENKLHKIRQTNQTRHMIMPSKDTLYNGRIGIGFENPSYFEKAKDLRPSLYDEKVIGLGYTLMFLIHSDEALETEKFKRARENKIEFAYDYGNLNASYVNEKINFSDDYFQEIINPDFERIDSPFQQTSSLKPIDSPFQQTSSLKPYVSTVILEKIIIDLKDKVVSLLEKEKANLETIESLKSKGFESSENVISESENQSENDCQVVEKGCDKMETLKVIASGMFKLNVSQSVSPISVSKTSCASENVENKTKRKRRKRKSSKQNDKQVNSGVLRANRDFVHFLNLDTFSSVRRPKHSGVIWKKKWLSNTSTVDLSSVSHLKLNKDVKRYSRKDLLSCNNSHLEETSSAYVCNDATNVSIVQICLWIIDSGCSKHMTSNRALLTNFVEKSLGTVRFGDNDFAVIVGYGDVVIGSMTITKVYYVERLRHNLFSVGKFCDKGLEVAFRKSTCFVRNEDGVDLLTGDRSSNLYTIALNEVASNSSTYLLAKASSSQSFMKFEKDRLCSACEQGKIHWKHHKSKTAFASNKPLYLLHMDLYGPMRVESINGKRYVLVVVDDYSRYTWRVRTNNGTKFKKKNLAKFFDEVGMCQQFSAARTPQQNGVVERRNRTLVEAARTMLTFTNLPLFLWAEAIATACFTQNRLIIHKRFDKTPNELINKRKPNIKFFRVFGCRCYLLNDYDDVGKLKTKGDIRVFVRYSKESVAFIIYNK